MIGDDWLTLGKMAGMMEMMYFNNDEGDHQCTSTMMEDTGLCFILNKYPLAHNSMCNA